METIPGGQDTSKFYKAVIKTILRIQYKTQHVCEQWERDVTSNVFLEVSHFFKQLILWGVLIQISGQKPEFCMLCTIKPTTTYSGLHK